MHQLTFPIKVTMKHSILIIEDEKIVREGLARTLSQKYETYQASDGREAIEIINENNNIKVVISDLKNPEADGFKLLEKIHSENPDINVIFLTAFFSVESAVEAMKKGAFDYITKPLDLKKLEITVSNAIDNISGQNPSKKPYKGGSS